MAVGGRLVFACLRAGTSHHRFESELFTRRLASHCICAVRQECRVPKRLTFFSDKDRIAGFQFYNGVEKSHAERNVVEVGQCLGQGQFIGRAVTGLALHILNILLARMDVAVAHYFIAGVAVHTVEGVLALREVRDGLIVVLRSCGRVIIALDEGHRPQVIIAAVVTGIALGVWNGG